MIRYDISLINLENVTGLETDVLSYFVKITEKKSCVTSFERLDDGCIIFTTKSSDSDIELHPVYRKVLRVFIGDK